MSTIENGVQENNKLIAEFMEIDKISSNVLREAMLNDLEYHSDWNELMKVVEKIEELGFWVDISGSQYKHCRIGIMNSFNPFINKSENSKIEAVYNACLDFIKYYNEQSK